MKQGLSSALAQGNQTQVVCVIQGERPLTVKEVEFLGDDLLVVKDEIENKVYAGVGYICRGIGFSKSQKDTQVQNIQNDLVLREGCLKFQAGVIDPNNDVLAIDIDYLPLWLAKISITPKMKEQQSELVDKLVNYQLKVKDVLASVFVHKNEVDLSDYSQEMQAILMQDKKIKVVEKRVTDLEDNIHITRSQQKQLKQFASKVLVSAMGSKYSNAYKKFSGKIFSAFWHDYYNHFNVSSYLDTPKQRFQEALQFINDWKPNEEIKFLIVGANTQMTLED